MRGQPPDLSDWRPKRIGLLVPLVPTGMHLPLAASTQPASAPAFTSSEPPSPSPLPFPSPLTPSSAPSHCLLLCGLLTGP